MRTVLTNKSGRPARRARKNGTLMLVGAANPKKNAVIREYVVPIAKAPKVDPRLRKMAVENHQKFQGKKPTRVRVIEYDDGRKGVRDVVCYGLGKAEITVDTVQDKNGREIQLKEPMRIGSVYKAPTHGKKKGAQFVHSFKEDGGRVPVKAIDVETGVEHTLGGTYKVRGEEWIRR